MWSVTDVTVYKFPHGHSTGRGNDYKKIYVKEEIKRCDMFIKVNYTWFFVYSCVLVIYFAICCFLSFVCLVRV